MHVFLSVLIMLMILLVVGGGEILLSLAGFFSGALVVIYIITQIADTGLYVEEAAGDGITIAGLALLNADRCYLTLKTYLNVYHAFEFGDDTLSMMFHSIAFFIVAAIALAFYGGLNFCVNSLCRFLGAASIGILSIIISIGWTVATYFVLYKG